MFGQMFSCQENFYKTEIASIEALGMIDKLYEVKPDKVIKVFDYIYENIKDYKKKVKEPISVPEKTHKLKNTQ